MSRNWAVRILRGVKWRLARSTTLLVLRACPSDSRGAPPEGCVLTRVAGTRVAAQDALVDRAMRSAGEPDGLTAPRFAHGDEFFGWRIGSDVVAFGWATYRDRTVGAVRLAEGPGRVFLFNFCTLEGYRGRGLYPALLLNMRHDLGREHVTEFFIEVDVVNAASVRGIEKAGFVPVARITYLTIFNRWSRTLNRHVIDGTGPSPF